MSAFEDIIRKVACPHSTQDLPIRSPPNGGRSAVRRLIQKPPGCKRPKRRRAGL